ncbi:MAG: hypothetical protein ACLT49_07990 [Sutterella wadsworthensis]
MFSAFSPFDMTEFFNVQLSSMGMGLMVLIPVLLALFFWVIGRVVPPARRPAGRPAGLGGLLCVVLLILFVKAALSLFELGRQAGKLPMCLPFPLILSVPF